jgi:hypothetical protein
MRNADDSLVTSHLISWLIPVIVEELGSNSVSRQCFLILIPMVESNDCWIPCAVKDASARRCTRSRLPRKDYDAAFLTSFKFKY